MLCKRKTTTSESLTRCEKRELVVHALVNAARADPTGTTGATAVSERFPLSGPAFKGDREELHLPLTPEDTSTRKIKARAAGIANDSSGSVWEVEGAALELRNPRWAPFLDECLTAMREKLAIAPAAVVSLSLRKMALVEAGVQPTFEREEAEENAEQGVVFGSFVMLLPSTFEAGKSGVLYAPPTHDETAQRNSWAKEEETPTRHNAYDMQYAAFYHGSPIVVEPVANGEALFLVYDLVTTTPHEIPLVVGPQALQRELDDALSDYFDIVPTSLAKRFKISAEAARTINEFVVDDRFLYPVKNYSFETLQDTDKRAADRLAAFCEQSQGQYALYLVHMKCTLKKSRHSRHDTTYSVYLDSPCYRPGEANKRLFPRTAVHFRDELSHALETLEYYDCGRDVGCDVEDPDDWSGSDGEDDHDYKTKEKSSTPALVVQPVTLEHAQWAKGPRNMAVEQLEELAKTSPKEAARLARRVLAAKHKWDSDDDNYIQFVQVVVALDDASLFHSSLHSVTDFEYPQSFRRDPSGGVPQGVRHFGWDSCLATIENILEQPQRTFRSCVNFVCLVLLDTTNTDHIDRLMSKLATRAPWAGPRTVDDGFNSYDERSREVVTRLFHIALRSSVSTLLQLISTPDAKPVTWELLVPTLVALTGELSTADRSLLLPVLRSLRDTIEAVIGSKQYARYQPLDRAIVTDVGHWLRQ